MRETLKCEFSKAVPSVFLFLISSKAHLRFNACPTRVENWTLKKYFHHLCVLRQAECEIRQVESMYVVDGRHLQRLHL